MGVVATAMRSCKCDCDAETRCRENVKGSDETRLDMRISPVEASADGVGLDPRRLPDPFRALQAERMYVPASSTCALSPN